MVNKVRKQILRRRKAEIQVTKNRLVILVMMALHFWEITYLVDIVKVYLCKYKFQFRYNLYYTTARKLVVDSGECEKRDGYASLNA